MTAKQKVIKNKIGLLNLANQLADVSQARKVLGCSRGSFHRYKRPYETGGEEALREIWGNIRLLKS